jgi:hypothetical protein
MIRTILTTLLMITSIPLGLFLSKYLKEEQPITKAYFKPFLWILAIASAILISINLSAALTTIYLFFLILTWHRFSR